MTTTPDNADVLESTAITIAAKELLPVLTMEQTRQRYEELVTFTKTILREDVDYGIIPGGEKQKRTLLKPGAEKLCLFFNLRPSFVQMPDSIAQWSAPGFFHYRYKCQLHNRSGQLVSEGIGSCNTKEKKYRYRYIERICPDCHFKGLRFSSKNNRFFCPERDGGCGGGFQANDGRITSQKHGKEENTEPYDLVNTIDKMAQKRSLIAATLIGTGASEFFTQDLEDFLPEESTTRTAPRQQQTQPAAEQEPPADDGDQRAEGEQAAAGKKPARTRKAKEKREPVASEGDPLVSPAAFLSAFAAIMAERPEVQATIAESSDFVRAAMIKHGKVDEQKQPDFTKADGPWRTGLLESAKAGIFDKTFIDMRGRKQGNGNNGGAQTVAQTSEELAKVAEETAPAKNPEHAHVDTWKQFESAWEDAALAQGWTSEQCSKCLNYRLMLVSRKGKEKDTSKQWRADTLGLITSGKIDRNTGETIKEPSEPNK